MLLNLSRSRNDVCVHFDYDPTGASTGALRAPIASHLAPSDYLVCVQLLPGWTRDVVLLGGTCRRHSLDGAVKTLASYKLIRTSSSRDRPGAPLDTQQEKLGNFPSKMSVDSLVPLRQNLTQTST